MRAAGVTRGALYHHFRDKEDLFAAVFEQVEGELMQRIGAGRGEHAADPRAELRWAPRPGWTRAPSPRSQRIVLLDAPAVLGRERWREIALRNGLGLVVAALQAAIDAGQIAPQPVDRSRTC